MSLSFGDPLTAMLADLCRQEVEAGYSPDLRVLDAMPCPVCGLRPRARVPYRGAVLSCYRDAEAGYSTFFWCCKPCDQELRAGRVPVGTVRARVKEWCAA